MALARVQIKKTLVQQTKSRRKLDIHCDGQMQNEKFWMKHLLKSTLKNDLKLTYDFSNYLLRNKIFISKSLWYYFFVGIFPM